jgi:hypothetical protein
MLLMFRTDSGDFLAKKALKFMWTDDANEAAIFVDDCGIPDEFRGVDFSGGAFVEAVNVPVGAKFERWLELSAIADEAFERAMSGAVGWPVAETRTADAADFWRSDLDHCATSGMRNARHWRIGRNLAALAPETAGVFIA